MDDSNLKNILPEAHQVKFAPGPYSLAHKLQYNTAPGKAFHAIKEHIGEVQAAFAKNLFAQKQIKMGGYGSDTAKRLFRKTISAIAKKDPSITSNEFKKGIIKKIFAHYEKKPAVAPTRYAYNLPQKPGVAVSAQKPTVVKSTGSALKPVNPLQPTISHVGEVRRDNQTNPNVFTDIGRKMKFNDNKPKFYQSLFKPGIKPNPPRIPLSN